MNTCRKRISYANKSGGNKAAIDDFKKIQRYMQLAKEENAQKTYAELKREFH